MGTMSYSTQLSLITTLPKPTSACLQQSPEGTFPTFSLLALLILRARGFRLRSRLCHGFQSDFPPRFIPNCLFPLRNREPAVWADAKFGGR